MAALLADNGLLTQQVHELQSELRELQGSAGRADALELALRNEAAQMRDEVDGLRTQLEIKTAALQADSHAYERAHNHVCRHAHGDIYKAVELERETARREAMAEHSMRDLEVQSSKQKTDECNNLNDMLAQERGAWPWQD